MSLDRSQTLINATVARSGSTVRLQFARKADNGGSRVLNLDGPLDFNWARGASMLLAQHGASDRGSFRVGGE